MDYQGFYDLNISVNALKDSKNLFKNLYKFGYRTVAINYVIEETALDVKANKKRKGGGDGNSNVLSNFVPVPQKIDLPEELIGKLKVLNRLTLEFSDGIQFVKVRQSENFKMYDLLAAIPKNEAALQQICISFDFDIISFNSVEKPIKFNRKMYNLAVSKNMFFEIYYVPMLNSTACRRNTIQTAHGYHAYGRSKNIIITSGAENHLQIRGPYDVINLGILFGLSLEQSKRAINQLSKEVILKGGGRKCGNALMVISKIDNQNDDKDQTSSTDGYLPAKKRLKQFAVKN